MIDRDNENYCILNNNEINDYIGNTIYIIQYPCYHENQKLAVSYGILKNKFEDKEYNFIHYCSTEYGSSGSPILNIKNNKVIGIHKQRTEKKLFNIGSFLHYSIKEFIDKYKEMNTLLPLFFHNFRKKVDIKLIYS